MCIDDSSYKTDMENICKAECIPWEMLSGSTLFITGATGLIGFALINALLYANRKRKLGLHIIALVRNERRAKERLGELFDQEGILRLIEGDVVDLPVISSQIDYIIHGACVTASREFIVRPVETIQIAVQGTQRVLNLAREKNVRGFVYLSSMEVYGYPEKGHKVQENEIGALSPLELRNSYPLSKQLCENLCCAYTEEYKVPAMIIRLAQTFGPGTNYNDSRIFAEFGRCVSEKRDIVLKTTGETERNYLYTADAVTAILTVLLKGKPGQAYNAADESIYCSIAEMAYRIACAGGVQVRFDVKDGSAQEYPSINYLAMDTALLRELGWEVSGRTMEKAVSMYKSRVERSG